MLEAVLPTWVEPDPLRSRAVDALGLQSVADRLADGLLPGLSVATTRARYFSFLCWGRGGTGKTLNEREVHRAEVALAISEYRVHEADGQKCSYFGSRSIKSRQRDTVPADPREVYKTSAWSNYRPSLVALELIADSPRFELTECGERARMAFQHAIGTTFTSRSQPPPETACLSRVKHSSQERKLLKEQLGFSLNGSPDRESTEPRTKRAMTWRRLRACGELTAEKVLPDFERLKAKSLPEPDNTLRAAAVWEYLALGLNVIFVAWVQWVEGGKSTDAFAEKLATALKSRRRPNLEVVSFENVDFDDVLSRAVGYLRRARALFASLADQSRQLLEDEPFQLVETILRCGKRAIAAKELIRKLWAMHLQAKGDEAWLRCRDGDPFRKTTINRETKRTWQPPDKVRPHGYRLNALSQLARDLGYWK